MDELDYMLVGNIAYVFGEFENEEALMGRLSADVSSAFKLKNINRVLYGPDFSECLRLSDMPNSDTSGLGDMPEDDEDDVPWA